MTQHQTPETLAGHPCIPEPVLRYGETMFRSQAERDAAFASGDIIGAMRRWHATCDYIEEHGEWPTGDDDAR